MTVAANSPTYFGTAPQGSKGCLQQLHHVLTDKLFEFPCLAVEHLQFLVEFLQTLSEIEIIWV
jgi:hypothetical protein